MLPSLFLQDSVFLLNWTIVPKWSNAKKKVLSCDATLYFCHICSVFSAANDLFYVPDAIFHGCSAGAVQLRPKLQRRFHSCMIDRCFQLLPKCFIIIIKVFLLMFNAEIKMPWWERSAWLYFLYLSEFKFIFLKMILLHKYEQLIFSPP